MNARYFLLGLAAVAMPATAQITFEEPAPPPPPAKAKSSDRLVCEKEEQIGSRLATKKVCMTAEQWQEQRARHREQLEKFQQQNTSTGTPSGGI
jgi:invasion protein IalB